MLARQGSDGFVMFVRSFGRPKVIKGATLACLEGLLDESELDKVFVVLLHPQERYVTYSCMLPRPVVL